MKGYQALLMMVLSIVLMTGMKFDSHAESTQYVVAVSSNPYITGGQDIVSYSKRAGSGFTAVIYNPQTNMNTLASITEKDILNGKTTTVYAYDVNYVYGGVSRYAIVYSDMNPPSNSNSSYAATFNGWTQYEIYLATIDTDEYGDSILSALISIDDNIKEFLNNSYKYVDSLTPYPRSSGKEYFPYNDYISPSAMSFSATFAKESVFVSNVYDYYKMSVTLPYNFFSDGLLAGSYRLIVPMYPTGNVSQSYNICSVAEVVGISFNGMQTSDGNYFFSPHGSITAEAFSLGFEDSFNLDFSYSGRFGANGRLHDLFSFSFFVYLRVPKLTTFSFPSTIRYEIPVGGKYRIMSTQSSVLDSHNKNFSDLDDSFNKAADSFSDAQSSLDSVSDLNSHISDVDGVVNTDVLAPFKNFATTATLFGTVLTSIWNSLGDFAIPLSVFLTLTLVSVMLGVFGRLRGGE